MKNIFTTKVKWFKSKPLPLPQHDWTHVYTNSLGDDVQCIITEDLGNNKWVLNVNGCKVRLMNGDLRLIG